MTILCSFWNDISWNPRNFKAGRNLGTSLAFPPCFIDKETEMETEVRGRTQASLRKEVSLPSVFSFLMYSLFIHSSSFLFKSFKPLPAASPWLSSLQVTWSSNLGSGTNLLWWRYASASCLGTPSRRRYWSSKEREGFADSWGQHNSSPLFPLSGYLFWVQMLNYCPSYFYWLAVEIYWTSNVYLSPPLTLIIWLITPNLVIPWLSTLEQSKGVVYV